MQHCYLFHPGGYSLGRIGRFYTRLAARGWLLEKRGVLLSRFRRADPQALACRILVAAPKEQAPLPPDTVQALQQAGWQHRASQGMLHLFFGPPQAAFPPACLPPGLLEETGKALRREEWAFLLGPFIYLVFAGIGAWMSSDGSGIRLWAQVVRAWLEAAPLLVGAGCLFAWFFLSQLGQALQLRRLRRQLGQGGLPPQDGPTRGEKRSRALAGGLAVGAVGLLALQGIYWARRQVQPLPAQADGPYLVLEDLGIQGQRDTLMGKAPEVCFSPSLLAEHWDVFETLQDGSGWMYQDVYRMARRQDAPQMAWALRSTSIFAQSAQEYRPVQIPGMDGAWVCDQLEAVAMKGDLVCMVTAPLPAQGLAEVLEQMALRWQQEP